MKSILLALTISQSLFASVAAAEIKADKYRLSISESLANWEGRKIGGTHQGELRFKSGELIVNKGAVTGGIFEIDMTSLKDNDLKNPEFNQKLVTHLRSDDFFSVQKHPTSTFRITRVEHKEGKSLVTGNLTIKGITHPVTFPANITYAGNEITAEGEMTVDRTLYDIKYRSMKFFSDLGDKVIRDEFIVRVNLKAIK